MFTFNVTFLIITLVVGVLGFGIIAGLAAKVLFLSFLTLFVLTLLRGRRATN